LDSISTWSTLTVVSGTNHGTIELTSTSGAGNARIQDGALTNASDGVINVLTGSGGGRYWNADLTNQGTVTVSQTLTMGKASAVLANSGSIQVNENVTVTSPSFTNSGTISVAGGKTFQVNNGGLTHSSGGMWSGAGSVALYNVTVTLTADFSEAVAVTLSSSTVNGSGRIWTNGAGGC
jgi:hypothetical protein